MHVSPADFRAARRDGVVLHYALLGAGAEVAYVLAEFPSAGSRGTFAEELCEDEHWSFVVRGSLEVDLDGTRRDVAAGSAFHIPAGVPHRLFVPGRARLAGFAPVERDLDTTDDALRRAGFEPLSADVRRPVPSSLAIARTKPERPSEPGEVLSETRRMGSLLFSRTRLGRRAGFVGEACDLAHWGLVTEGSVAIEWEDDVEVVTVGDVYYCPAGPPAHRIQAADPAVIVDFTPVDAFRTADRIVQWRRAAGARALEEAGVPDRLEVAALV